MTEWHSPLVKVNCPRCGSWENRVIVETRDLEILECISTFRLSQCNKCMHIYTSIRPEESFLFTKHYPDDYLCYGKMKGRFTSALDTLRIKKQAESRAMFVNRIMKFPQKLSILEIGCATGEFLRVGKRKYGWSVCGIEPNETLCTRDLTEECSIINSTFENTDLPEHSFDVVCLFNVFEHLWDPVLSLKRINILLRPGGVMIFEIPNMGAVARSVFKEDWFLYHLPRHLTQFTLASLDSFMRDEDLFSKIKVISLFRPTVNAISVKYKERRLFSNATIFTKFFTESNPLILTAAIFLEIVFNLFGRPNHVVAVYKKLNHAKNISSPLEVVKMQV